MRAPLSLLLAMTLLAACQGGPSARVPTPSATKRPTPRPLGSAVASRPPAAATTAAAAQALAPLGLTRPLGTDGVAVSLTGKVKVIGNNGAGVISNNGGGIVSNNGGGVISNNGGGIVSNNGGGVVSNNGSNVVGNAGARYGVRQAPAAPPESLLADARIEVLDAQRRVLVDAQGEPIGTTTDRNGQYTLSMALPDENLLLRIRLWNGGELYAFLVRAKAGGKAQVDVDTASTFGTAYVLTEYVKDRQAVLDRLPGAEADGLHAGIEAARHLAPVALTTYRLDDMAKATAELRAKAPPVDSKLERIKELLLLGQSQLGAGLLATEVALAFPSGVHRDARGNTYVAETLGRVRRIAPDGRISLYAGFGAAAETNLTELAGVITMTGLPDGTLFLAELSGRRVWRLAPDGEAAVIAGGGTLVTGGGRGTDLALRGVTRLAVAPDGTALYLVDNEGEDDVLGASRLLRLDLASGQATALPCPPPRICEEIELGGLAAGPDGSLYVAVEPRNIAANSVDAGMAAHRVHRLAPDGRTWTLYSESQPGELWHQLALLPDGRVVGLDVARDRIVTIDPAGTRGLLLGGAAPARGAGEPADGVTADAPVGMWIGPGGEILVAASDERKVYEIGKDGALRLVAGVDAGTQVGLAKGLPINGPAGVAFDAQGRLVVSETRSNLIKRLDGDTLSVLVGKGGESGAWGSATAALETRLVVPKFLGFAGPRLYFTEGGSQDVVRYLDADGFVRPLGPHGAEVQISYPPLPATLGISEFGCSEISGMAIDRAGRVHIADIKKHLVLRFDPADTLTVVAGPVGAGMDALGGFAGDGGPATKARLNGPAGLAFDSKGNLYVSDVMNGRVRRIGPTGTIETYAGLGTEGALAKVLAGEHDTGPVAAKDAVLIAPHALAIDADDNLYVAELGTTLSFLLGPQGAALAALPKLAPSVRKITPDGRTTFVAGRGAAALSGADGGEALQHPAALAIDAKGGLCIADNLTSLVHVIPKEAL